jgi:HNH endonuclease
MVAPTAKVTAKVSRRFRPNATRRLGDGTVAILLSLGKVTIVDESDYSLVSGYRWHSKPEKLTVYARAHARTIPVSGMKVSMQNIILGASETVDHIDGDGLNNRRSNLRLCSQAQNQWNAGKHRRTNSTSKFKGVWKSGKHWGASICVKRRKIFLGQFGSEESAAYAYDAAARELHGEFARLNFPEVRA